VSESVPPSRPLRRVFLLGASNLTRGLPVALNTARDLTGGPIEVFAALGHGRSYGITSSVLGRTLPSILECGLWESLDQQKLPIFSLLSTQNSALRTQHSELSSPLALITDIGNDIMYEQTPAAIADWVEQCVVRLRNVGATVALTQLPLGSIGALRPWKYRLLRSVLFPTRHLPFEDALQRLHELQGRLAELAERFELSFIELPAEWYGVDPIHMRRRVEPEAWLSILSQAFAMNPSSSQPLTSSFAWRWRCRFMRPQQWSLLGIQRYQSQPTALVSDGSTISLF